MVNKDTLISLLLQQNEQLRLQVEQLEEQVALLRTENKLLKEKTARLEKNSSNSSKPPSSDIINPKPTGKRGRKRKRGGQPGHKKYSRQPFTAEQIDNTLIHELSDDEVCRRSLIPLDETKSVLQQIGLPEKLYHITDHRVRLYMSSEGTIVKAKLPREIRKEGLVYITDECICRLSQGPLPYKLFDHSISV